MTEFKLKSSKTRKQGTCSAARCKAQAVDLLCPEHEQAWREAGSPSLDEPGALVPVVVQAGLAEERHTAQECLDLITRIPLDSEQDRERMAGFVRQAQDLAKTLEKRRTDVTGPLNQALRTVNAWFRPVRDLYESIEHAGKDRLKAGLQQAQAAQDQALARIQAAGGQGSASTLMLAHATPDLPAGVSARDLWTFVVVDESALPREYLTPDLTKIGRVVRAEGAECVIPGIRVERDLTLSVRSKP